MFSILNKLFPSIKSRLLFAISSTFTFLACLTLIATYVSMNNALVERLLSHLNNRFIALEEEYSDELFGEGEHIENPKNDREIRTKRELSDELEIIQEVLNDRKEWVYLVSASNELLLKSSNAPDYQILKFPLEKSTGFGYHENTEFLYSIFKLPDENMLVLTADLKAKNDYLSLYLNRFLAVNFIVLLLSVGVCYFIIKTTGVP